jgi:hypothetical protein
MFGAELVTAICKTAANRFFEVFFHENDDKKVSNTNQSHGKLELHLLEPSFDVLNLVKLSL